MFAETSLSSNPVQCKADVLLRVHTTGRHGDGARLAEKEAECGGPENGEQRERHRDLDQRER